MLATLTACLLTDVSLAAGAKPGSPADPTEKVELSPTVLRLLDDPLTPEPRRRAMSLFHGQWQRLLTPDSPERAAIALAQHRYDAPELSDESTPAMLRARARLLAGQPELVESLLAQDTSAPATQLRAAAMDQLGRFDAAVTLMEPWQKRLLKAEPSDKMTAADLTASAQMLILLARIKGRPAQDYQLALAALTRVREEIDPLHWPSLLAEAQLLHEKDNSAQAAEALQAALALNPRCSEAWHLLGCIGVDTFNFELASRCSAKLLEINPTHPLAALLSARAALAQRDPAQARKQARSVLERYPTHRMALALLAGAEALAYNEQALNQTLARFDELSSGSATALFITGRYLALAKQYEPAEKMLRAAVDRCPNWPEAHVELGLLLMDFGKEEEARTELATATALDPFNRRAANQFKLADELSGYERVQTDHFIIKFRAGVDRVLALDMPEELENIYREMTGVFQHRPSRRTLIEILPDEQHFGVRMTGMPEIWTIGASSGDVIAITPPRPGAKQRGAFDWVRVIRHEFVHTVTLSQTANRVPHWFTEACAVSQEPGGRDYQTCELLASALKQGKLFALDQIMWGFVRPKTPAERPLAYAQSHWMLEYITATYGHSSVIKLLELYRQGVAHEAALQQVTGRSSAEFLEDFKAWGKKQVVSWGLGDQPGDEAVQAAIKRKSLPAELDALLLKYPGHPDLMRAAAERAIAAGNATTTRASLIAYAAARPTDLWPHKQIVALGISSGQGDDQLLGSLEQLDRQEQLSGTWAFQLAQLHRGAGQLVDAQDAARRALTREPYNAIYRELAATIALQQGDSESALRHLRAMTLLEPDRASHFVRLAALLYRSNLKDEARAAAEAARKLDANAPVDRFLQ